MNGKGDKDRTSDRERYRAGYEAINWKNKQCPSSPTEQHHRLGFNETTYCCMYCGEQTPREQDA